MKKNILSSLFIVFVAIFLFASPAKASSVTLYPAADSWLDSANPNTAHPTGNLRFYFNGSTWQWSSVLLKFDLSSIPAGSTINSGFIDVYYASCSGYIEQPLWAKRVTSPWVEDTATWQIMQNRVTTSGQVAARGTTCIVDDHSRRISIDLTEMTKGWFAGSFVNYGIRIDGDQSGGTANYDHWAYSKDTSPKPDLVIDYTPPTSSGSTTPAGGTTNTTGGTATGNSNTGTSTGSSNTTGSSTGNVDTSSQLDNTKNEEVKTELTKDSLLENPIQTIKAWPWWKIAIAIWVIFLILAMVSVGIILIIRKIRNRQNEKI